MDLREALQALRSAWWLPVLGLIVGGVVALGITASTPQLYTATTQLFVSTRGADSQEVIAGSRFSQDRVTSYARLLNGDDLATRVVDRLDLDLAPQQLSGQISAAADPDTVLIDVSITDPSPEQAQRIAEAIGIEFRSLVADLETPAGGGASLVEVTVTDEPELPGGPSQPQPTRNVAVGLLAGLMAGGLGALARARLDRSITDPEVATHITHLPVIGSIRRDAAMARGERHLSSIGADDLTADDYRKLRANLQFLSVNEPPKVIMVSSAMPSEGKTATVLNLAHILNETGRSVTIVEADLRRPQAAKSLGMVTGAGLTNVLAGTADVDDVLQRYGERNLHLMAAGPTPPNPSELLTLPQMSALIDKLRGSSDYVLIDAAPLLPVADSTALAVLVDGVLLCVHHGSTTREQLQEAVATLHRVGAKPLGLILNRVPPGSHVTSGYGYRYSAQ